MSRRKPFNDRAGYVASLRNPTSGGWCVIYKAHEAGLDPSGGNWLTVCEVHGTLCNHTSLKLARASMKSPDFCEACESNRNRSTADRERAWAANAAGSRQIEEGLAAAKHAIRNLLETTVKPEVDSGYWQCVLAHLARVDLDLLDVPQLKGLHDLLDSLIKRN